VPWLSTSKTADRFRDWATRPASCLEEIERSAGSVEQSLARAELLAAKAVAYLVDDTLDDAIEAGEQAVAAAGPRTNGPGSTRRPPWGARWCSWGG